MTVREGLWKSEVFAALSKGTGVPVAEYTAAAKDAGGARPARRRQGQRRGLPLPGDLRVPGQGDRGPAAQDHGRQGHRRARQGRGRARRTTRRRSSSPRSSRARPGSPTAARSPAWSRTASRTRPARPSACCRWTRRSTSRSRSAATSPRPSTTPRSPNPYNTYAHKGLPPGPISSPGAGRDRGRGQPRPRARGSTSSRSTPTPARRCSPPPRPSTTATTPQRQTVVRREQAEVRGRWLTRAGRRSSGLRWRTRCRRCCTHAGYRTLGLTSWSYAAHELRRAELAGVGGRAGRDAGGG